MGEKRRTGAAIAPLQPGAARLAEERKTNEKSRAGASVTS